MILREVFLYKYIIGDRRLMMKRSKIEWMQLVLFWPILSWASKFIFATLAIDALLREVLAQKSMFSHLTTLFAFLDFGMGDRYRSMLPGH